MPRGVRHDTSADLLIFAPCIYRTAFDRRPVGALAVKDGRIVALGSRRQLTSLRGLRTRVIELRAGAAVTAGLVDSHTHFFYWALNRRLVIDVSGLPTLEATLAKIKSEARTRRVAEWIVARGFDYNVWGGRVPTAADLDLAIEDAPAMVRSRDGHTAWLNSRALAKHAAVLADDEPRGRILRDARGRPTGVVQEATIDRLLNPVFEFARRTDQSARTVDDALRNAYQIAWDHGVVAVHCMDDTASLAHFQRQRTAQRLGVRIAHSIPHLEMNCALRLGIRSGLGDDWLRIAAVKLFSDGALGSQTAYMFDSYPGRGRYIGVPNVAGQALRDDVAVCARYGLAVWIHAIGDRAAAESINAIIAARKVEAEPLPHRIEHAQCVRPTDIRRMAKWKIAASVQPCHLLGDVDNADKHWPRARKNAYPLRSMLDAGVVLAAGSDVPIESIDPRRSFFAATTRTKEDGEPRGGWFPAQKITAREALHAFTRGAAASVGEPLPNGTIAVGGRADLTLWRDDPVETPPAELRDVRIAGCVIDGKPHLSGAV